MQPFAQRVVAHEALQPIDHVGVSTQRQFGVDQTLLGGDEEPLEPGRRLPGEREVGEVTEGRSTEQRDRRLEPLRRAALVIVAGEALCSLDEPFHPLGVDVVGFNRQHVARTLTDDGVPTEEAAEDADLGLQRVRRVGERLVPPHLGDQSAVADGPGRRERAGPATPAA